jgi:thioredoxin-dependent peroxiredoxin
MKSIEVGDRAPEFTATASDGRRVSLSDFHRKQAVVVFFYPRDNSPVCTQEACAFRDAFQDFVEAGAAVIGVSGDSDESHRAFAATQHLPYFLIADPEGDLRKLFGVRNSLIVIPSRVTFVIDREGIVRHKFSSLLRGTRHVEEALQTVRRLGNVE